MEQSKKIHPKKFLMWLAMGSICMLFAGFTSAAIVKKGLGNWESLQLPWAFYISTIVIIISSITIHQSVQQYKTQKIVHYRSLLLATILLGAVFCIFQIIGFIALHDKGFFFIGYQSNSSSSFLFIIVIMHALHVIGGWIVLCIIYIQSFYKTKKEKALLPLEITAIYWHFVDILWVYLFLFFMWIK